MQYIKSCRNCNKKFKTNLKLKVCCSESCRDKSKPSRIKRKPKTKVKFCKICKKSFMTNNKQVLCCSKNCSKNNALILNKQVKKQPKWINYQKEYSKKWYFENKERLKPIRALAHKKYKDIKQKRVYERLKNDPVFKLSRVIRTTIKNRLFACNVKKDKQTIELVGWNFLDLKNHLESQFDSKMSWNNFGSYWQIDHIVPLSWFKTRKQVLNYGWALKNLQPLEKELNLSKNNHFVGNQKTNLEIIYL